MHHCRVDFRCDSWIQHITSIDVQNRLIYSLYCDMYQVHIKYNNIHKL